eukprot:TRINITY_DN42943_c0_g1_i1.p1 TRINITY_DN42943_c0_g1~~TRINITY_DN42943_c0_g1_i1.p1  ORF type:complete len:301 (-),score=28.68 TRINITY_DN42943_c0_g1_i1:50-850(-)
MSDHAKVCFCVPRLVVILISAIWIMGNYCLETCFFLIWSRFEQQLPLTPEHCSGKECNDVLTCRATSHVTIEVKTLISTAGGLICGYTGIRGAMYGMPRPLTVYAALLAAKVASVPVLFLVDMLYFHVCDAYSFNTIAEAMMFLPISDTIKRTTIRNRHTSYLPVGFLKNDKAESLMWICYLKNSVPYIIVCCVLSYLGFSAARTMSFGPIGLGVNYDFREWREGLNKNNAVTGDTSNFAAGVLGDIRNDRLMPHVSPARGYGTPV